MALYLPKQHIVLDIVDDPESAPVDPDAFPGLLTVPVTKDQLAQPATMRRLLELYHPCTQPDGTPQDPAAA